MQYEPKDPKDQLQRQREGKKTEATNPSVVSSSVGQRPPREGGKVQEPPGGIPATGNTVG